VHCRKAFGQASANQQNTNANTFNTITSNVLKLIPLLPCASPQLHKNCCKCSYVLSRKKSF